MVDVRTAVEAARRYLDNLGDLFGFPDSLQLEEIEVSPDEKYWLITMGYNRKLEEDVFGNPRQERHYKVLRVNRETGQVEAIKIREL